MKHYCKQVRRMAAVAGVSLLLGGCGTPMSGSSSLSLLSRPTDPSNSVKVIGDKVEESDTFRWFAIFGIRGPMVVSHEAIVQRMLEKYHADLLVDTEMEVSSVGVPYIYMEMKATVRGRPAVFVKGGAQ